MSATKIKGRILMPNFVPGDTTLLVEPLTTIHTGITTITQQKHMALPIMKRRLVLTAWVSAGFGGTNDYIGTDILDFSNTNLLVVATVVNVVGTMAGFTAGRVATDMTLSIGAAQTAHNDQSGTNEKTFCGAITGVGASTTATFQGVSTNAQSNAIIAAGSTNHAWLNLGATGTEALDGTMTLTGTIDFFYIDLGIHG